MGNIDLNANGNISVGKDITGRDKITNTDLGVHYHAETINIYTTPSSSEKQTTASEARYKISVECSNIVNLACDVIVLKYAQGFYGADKTVATIINETYPQNISPTPNESVLLPSRGAVTARQVLFIGTNRLYEFGYEQIREFSFRAIQILSQDMPSVKHVGMTIHGVGYGLDERESFFAQLAGLLEAIKNKVMPPFLERITIVELNKARAQRLKQFLQNQHLKEVAVWDDAKTDSSLQSMISAAGSQSNAKPHIFVALPFSDEMEDIYTFGIQEPVNIMGYLCERVDSTTFTGDILSRIKSRIDSASLVVANLTGANPNVYLEVGYAWGKNRPTLLVAKQGDDLKFDVQGQRCIMYKNISDLKKKLQADIPTLLQNERSQTK